MKAGLRSILARLPERDLWPLAALLFSAIAFFVFLQIGSEMMEGETRAFDKALIYALRVPDHPNIPIGPAWLESAAQDVTSLGSVVVLAFVTLAVAGYLALIARAQDALLLLVAVPGGLGFSTALKAFYDRPRPDLVPEAVAHLNASFPSGHAMLSAVTYLTLAAILARAQTSRKVKTYLYGLALLTTAMVGLSRVYLGLHWPSDVLAGWCVGAAWAILCRLAADYAPRFKTLRN
jgi:undecaprenyl-diphosphatase